MMHPSINQKKCAIDEVQVQGPNKVAHSAKMWPSPPQQGQQGTCLLLQHAA
jgi:hypothetical protein